MRDIVFNFNNNKDGQESADKIKPGETLTIETKSPSKFEIISIKERFIHPETGVLRLIVAVEDITTDNEQLDNIRYSEEGYINLDNDNEE